MVHVTRAPIQFFASQIYTVVLTRGAVVLRRTDALFTFGVTYEAVLVFPAICSVRTRSNAMAVMLVVETVAHLLMRARSLARSTFGVAFLTDLAHTSIVSVRTGFDTQVGMFVIETFAPGVFVGSIVDARFTFFVTFLTVLGFVVIVSDRTRFDTMTIMLVINTVAYISLRSSLCARFTFGATSPTNDLVTIIMQSLWRLSRGCMQSKEYCLVKQILFSCT